MNEVKNEWLEVGGVRAIVTDAFVSMIEAALGMKAPDCAPPAFIQSAIDRAIDRINSEAIAGYAVRDARIVELEAVIGQRNGELTSTNRVMCSMVLEIVAVGEALGISGEDQDGGTAEFVEAIDQLRAELVAAKETITRYETTAENCEAFRDELANQLEVKAFWIGRTRALEVELSAIKEQKPVSEVSEETFSSDGTSDVITHNLPIGTKLYTAPVAKQVVMPERATADNTCADQKWIYGWNSCLDQFARLNAADHIEHVRAMVVPDGYALIPIESLAKFPEINPANYGDDEVMALNNWAIDLVLAASPAAKEASQ